MAQQDKERFNRALRAMKPLGLATNAVNSTLKRLLKIYENEWELIEAESYRVLADAVFEYEEDLEKRKQARKQQRQAELEDEAERENVPRLTRARSQALALAYSQKRAEASGVSFEPATSSRQAQSRARESQGTAGGFKRPKDESPEREMSVFNGNSVLPPPPLPPRSLQRQGDGAEKKSICGLKRPKIEPNLDLPEPAACAGGFSTPVVEEKECEDRGLAGGLKKPKMELAVACASVDSVPLAVMDVLPIAAVNILSSPADTTGARSNPAVVEVQARADLSRFERIHEYHGGQDCSTQHSNSLGAIAEAYMEMDKEEDSAFELSLAEPEASLGALDSGLCNAQPCLDYNNGLQESALGQPRLEYNNGLQGLSHEQPCLEYNKSLQGLGHGQPYLQYSNGIQGSGHARCCTGYESSLKGLQHVQPNLDNNGGLKESNVPQPSLEMVLKRAEDYTLRSFKILFPNFPIMKMMEAFCLHFLKSRNSGIYGEARTETVSSVSNLLTSNDQGKVRRSSRISQRTQELPRPDKGKASSETKACVSKSKMLISLERSQQNVEESRPVHDLSDISRGEESIPLPVVNEVTSESSPPPFHYIQKSIVYQNAYVNFSLARVGDDDCCSNCFGNCLESPITCACARETGGEYAYTIDGLLKKEFLHEALSLQLNPQKHQLFYCKDCPIERSKNDHKPDPCKGHAIRKFIKECWSKCGCNKRCGNRVVQRGICRKLQVFFTPEGKGWGVRTLEGIPEGAFVCEYVGEILTNTELYIRNTERTGKEKHTYPVLLDADWCSEGVLKDEEALCLDATHYGNVARFINHRCFDANLTEFPVEVESPDRHYYHLAFFTTRKVEAQEELTWDYGIDFDDCYHPVKAFQCCCGSSYCRDRKKLASRRNFRP